MYARTYWIDVLCVAETHNRQVTGHSRYLTCYNTVPKANNHYRKFSGTSTVNDKQQHKNQHEPNVASGKTGTRKRNAYGDGEALLVDSGKNIKIAVRLGKICKIVLVH